VWKGQTDRQTGRQTDIILWLIQRCALRAMRTHCKNEDLNADNSNCSSSRAVLQDKVDQLVTRHIVKAMKIILQSKQQY